MQSRVFSQKLGALIYGLRYYPGLPIQLRPHAVYRDRSRRLSLRSKTIAEMKPLRPRSQYQDYYNHWSS